jgi:hypothetical protein
MDDESKKKQGESVFSDGGLNENRMYSYLSHLLRILLIIFFVIPWQRTGIQLVSGSTSSYLVPTDLGDTIALLWTVHILQFKTIFPIAKVTQSSVC